MSWRRLPVLLSDSKVIHAKIIDRSGNFKLINENLGANLFSEKSKIKLWQVISVLVFTTTNANATSAPYGEVHNFLRHLMCLQF